MDGGVWCTQMESTDVHGTPPEESDRAIPKRRTLESPPRRWGEIEAVYRDQTKDT
jgi:hypothetical protein